MRLFVGIAISGEIRTKIAAYMREMEAAVGRENKWVRPESLHVTLKFIGEYRDPEVIAKELESSRSAPISMSFKGVGFFTPRRPRIFWVGVEAGPELASLVSDIDERLSKVGVPKEPHTYEEFQPHVTLARTGSGRPFGSLRGRNQPAMFKQQDWVANQPQPDFGTMTAEEFILFRSETLPSGSRYTPLKQFALKSS